MELKETVAMMGSEDYKERLKAEYWRQKSDTISCTVWQ